MFDASLDLEIRNAAFAHMNLLSAYHGSVIPRTELERGFEFKGATIHLVGPQGIFKPKLMDLPLTITTSPNSPYDDGLFEDALAYKYRGEDPNHHENAGLREVMKRELPLIYFKGARPGRYSAMWPVFVVSDDPGSLTFGMQVDEKSQLRFHIAQTDPLPEQVNRRRYATYQAKRRIHQDQFREDVLDAYKEACSLCDLRRIPLLDAAHIIEDSDGGEPVVSNGLSLCKIHHTAFDRNILGIRPDYVAEIRRDVLEEEDGPMLKHGLQEMNNRKIYVPHRFDKRPDPDALEMRYEQFRAA